MSDTQLMPLSLYKALHCTKSGAKFCMPASHPQRHSFSLREDPRVAAMEITVVDISVLVLNSYENAVLRDCNVTMFDGNVPSFDQKSRTLIAIRC